LRIFGLKVNNFENNRMPKGIVSISLDGVVINYEHLNSRNQ
jgi:hypothetical protein